MAGAAAVFYRLNNADLIQGQFKMICVITRIIKNNPLYLCIVRAVRVKCNNSHRLVKTCSKRDTNITELTVFNH